MNKRFWFVAVLLFVMLAFATRARAQEAQGVESAWGAQASGTPSWVILPAIGSLFPGDANLRGSDVTIGITRGNIDRGDWGVSFIRRNVDKSSDIVDLGRECYGVNNGPLSCFETGDIWALHSVKMTGVEAHKFIPFFRIKQRVQIGATLAGGVAKMSGRVTKRSLSLILTRQLPAPDIFTIDETSEEMSVAGTLSEFGVPDWFPLGRLELTAALKVSQHVKLKVGGGFNFPGTSKVSVGAVYLF